MLGSDPTAQPRLPLSLRLASFRRCAGRSCDHGKVRCGLAGGPAVPAGDLSGAASAHTRLCLDPPLWCWPSCQGTRPAWHVGPAHGPRCPDCRQAHLPCPGPAEPRLSLAWGRAASRTCGCVCGGGDTQSNAWWVWTARPGTPTQRRSDGSVEHLSLAPRWACAARPPPNTQRETLAAGAQLDHGGERGWGGQGGGRGPPQMPGKGTVTA